MKPNDSNMTAFTHESADRAKKSIAILRHFEPKEGYYLAYSGGKDSDVCLRLLEMSGCKFDAHYNVTGVDPPELVQHVCRDHPEVQCHPPDKSMWTLIVEKKMPPTRLVRYCCEHLKEAGGYGRVVVTGVRWAESANRKANQGLVTVINRNQTQKREAMQQADEIGAEYRDNKRMGLTLNYDNEATREMVDLCYRTRKTMVNPIVDWSDEDVWDFIHRENIKYCKLYDQGFTRIGCIGCPLGSFASMRWELERYPGIRRMYVRAFDRMLEARKEAGLPMDDWKGGEDVMQWWTGNRTAKLKGQVTMDELMAMEAGE